MELNNPMIFRAIARRPRPALQDMQKPRPRWGEWPGNREGECQPGSADISILRQEYKLGMN